MKTRKLAKICAFALVLCLLLGMVPSAFAAEKVTFNDVAETDSFYPAVAWGVESGITNGVGDNRFDPVGQVTRAQVVTFLWRMAGTPTPKETETFTDVEKGSWYETAVQWAVENEITNGTGEGKFSPEAVCSRAMCITLLYRMEGAPLNGLDLTAEVTVDENSSLEDLGFVFIKEMVTALKEAGVFTDVPEGSYYEYPVIWGTLNGVLNEDNTGTATEAGLPFRPDDACVRKEMISFLYQTKLVEDAKNAPAEVYFGDYTVPIPQEYFERLYYVVTALADDEDGTLLTVSERASQDAAEAMGEEIDGQGELFQIVRVSEENLHTMMAGDMSGQRVFAKDFDGNYYIFQTPTDVRYVREDTDKMIADQDQWTELCEWANGNLIDDILKLNKELTPIHYTNTALDIYLARIGYTKDVNYTVSTTEFGPLKPGKVDPMPYVEYLLGGGFVEVEDAEAPDGEYVVLNFPDEGIRFDFFTADKNIVREVHGDYEVIYERATEGRMTNTEAMEWWYDALAKEAGKKVDYKEIDPYFGTWVEEIAGRGVITIKKSVAAPIQVDIEARWPDSAAVFHTWNFTANLAEDGKLVYENGTHTKTVYDEEEKRTVTTDTDAKGILSLTQDGKLVWQYNMGDEMLDGTFVQSK